VNTCSSTRTFTFRASRFNSNVGFAACGLGYNPSTGLWALFAAAPGAMAATLRRGGWTLPVLRAPFAYCLPHLILPAILHCCTLRSTIW